MLILFGIIHKLAHFIAKEILKRKKYISLQVQEIIVALAGPLINAIIIIITESLNINIFIGIMIVTANLIIIVFNLIPIYPMDGGKILKSILNILVGEKKGEQWIKKISFAILILITTASSIAILYLKNIFILLGVIYLWYRYLKYSQSATNL